MQNIGAIMQKQLRLERLALVEHTCSQLFVHAAGEVDGDCDGHAMSGKHVVDGGVDVAFPEHLRNHTGGAAREARATHGAGNGHSRVREFQ